MKEEVKGFALLITGATDYLGPPFVTIPVLLTSIAETGVG
jgi:hypothetical protein